MFKLDRKKETTQDLQKQILHVLAGQDISTMECSKAKFRSVDPSHVRKKAYELYIDSLQGLMKSAAVSDFIRSEYEDKIAEGFKELIESLDLEQPFFDTVKERTGPLKCNQWKSFHNMGRENRKKGYNLSVEEVQSFLSKLYPISYSMKDKGLSEVKPFNNYSLTRIIFFASRSLREDDTFEQFADGVIEQQRKEKEAV